MKKSLILVQLRRRSSTEAIHVAPWNLLSVPSPLCALTLSQQDRDAKITKAALEYNVTSFEATDPRELLEKINRINRNILIRQTDLATES